MIDIREFAIEHNFTPIEYEVLKVLATDPTFISAEKIACRVWGVKSRNSDLVKWHIPHMRRKLPDEVTIENRHGWGYRLHIG